MSQGEFREYTEQVFRFHNRVAEQAMMLAADDTVQYAWPLVEAEQHMIDVCHVLNDLVARSMRQQELPGWFTLRSLPDDVARCHRATLTVHALLP